MAEKITYKNHCTPQEKPSTGTRYYLDGDCGRKLSGSSQEDLGSTVSFSTAQAVTTSPTDIGTAKDFIFIKNIGDGSGNDLHISLNGTGGHYYIVLSSGEAFSSKIDASARIYVKCLSGDTTAEWCTVT